MKVNCPAIPGTLLESELFGYEKGAFTGAYGVKPGRVEMAHRGTLFLDEISELDMSLQSKLLQLFRTDSSAASARRKTRKLKCGSYARPTASWSRKSKTGHFAPDLFYRINVVNLHLPPLRERAQDIPELVDYFLEYHNRKYNCRAGLYLRDDGGVAQVSLAGKHPRTGKPDQAVCDSGQRRSDLRGSFAARVTDFFNTEIPVDGQISLKKLTRQAVRELERKVILKVLQNCHWNRKQAARALSISYRALLYKIRDAGLPSNRMVKQRAADAPKQDIAAD